MSVAPSRSPGLTRYGGALLCAGAALLLRLILQPLLGDASFHLFTLAVAVASLWGLGPGLLATAASAVMGELLLHPRAPFATGTVWNDPRIVLFALEGALVAAVIATAGRRTRHLREAQQARSEQVLRDAAADTQAILDSALDAVIGIDEAGTVTFWNPRAAEIFGWSEAEALGRSLAELVIRPSDRDLFREGLARFEATGQWPWIGKRVELLALRRDRSHFPVEMSVAARRHGARWQFDAFVADITERKETEERLARQREQVEASRQRALQAEQEARLAAEDASRMKDEFLATVSHELRTPLSAIVGWAQVLRDGALPEADVGRALASIDRNARAQAQLISDLLDVSRIVSGKLRLELQSINAAHVVEAAADTVRPTAEAKGVALEVEVARGAGPVLGDMHRLQQVVWNLLTNAVKFTPKGGRVRATVAPAGSDVAITVEDTGEGIDPGFLPHVFERFRQADASAARAHGGLGLGLAIVRHLVQLHRGSVSAHSDGPGRGSRFTVRLPALDAAAVAAARAVPAAALGSAPSLEGLCVLVVEDEADMREMLCTVLTRRGARVSVAEGADAALAALKRDHPHVLLSDLELPGMDGYALIRAVRALPEGKDVRAAALTGHARPEDRARALREGYQAHLVKPIEPEELVWAVAALTGRTQGAAEAAR